ncbi:MAG TPA: Hpt domain-containing protein [Cellvibrio sp.]|nr:Hpt domain-containing protein [Cellvibrio sp.]
MISDQHLDYDVINTLKDIMEDDFRFLVETYFQDSHSRISTLRNAVAIKDSDGVRRAAHSFKGSCSNLGALHLAGLCAALERDSLQENFAVLGSSIDVVENEFALVQKMLQEILI